MNKESRFGVGDLIRSSCGDYGIVREVGMRPDDEGFGIYAFWFKEGMCFWMDEDESQITLAVKNKEIDKSAQK